MALPVSSLGETLEPWPRAPLAPVGVAGVRTLDGAGPGTAVRTWPAAVADLVEPLVRGRVRPATVLGVFPTCVYLRVGDEDAGPVLAVLARDALALPVALRLGVGSGALCWGVQAGDRVEVGQGRVRLPGVTVVAVRTWRTPVVPSRGGRRGEGDRALASLARVEELARGEGHETALDPALVRDATALARAVAARDDAATRHTLLGLVGRGAGLTPGGDDAVCGVLLGLRAAGPPHAAEHLGRAAAPLLAATTSISAALVRAAAAGRAVPEVVDLLRSPSTERLDRVLAIGHSSGRDLVAGLVGAVRGLRTPGAEPALPAVRTAPVADLSQRRP